MLGADWVPGLCMCGVEESARTHGPSRLCRDAAARARSAAFDWAPGADAMDAVALLRMV